MSNRIRIRKLEPEAYKIMYDFEEYLKSNQPYMTSSQIEALIKKGFTFGAHSIDHPNYSNLSVEDQITQTVKSSNDISQKFELPYKVFSFPFTDYGLSKIFFESINKSLTFDITFGSAGLKSDIQKNHIQRIPLEEYDFSAKMRVKREYFYYVLKTPINLNTIKRT